MSSDELLAELRSAFGDVRRQPDECLFEQRDDYLWSEGLHGGTGQWWEVPADAIAHEPHALDELTVTGFKFFLPAYLSWIVQNPRSSYATADMAIYKLDLSGNPDPTMGSRKVRFESLSTPQRAAVVRFLEWAATCGDHLDAKAALKALRSYWSR